MGYLAVCAIVKNEAAYIREWLAFHAAVGVEHFYVFDNDSTDGTAELIRAFPFPEMVTLIKWPGQFAQGPAYRFALANFAADWTWMAFIDADEFLFSTETANLREFLRAFEHRAALAVHWLCYGSSGLAKPPLGLGIESFLHRAELGFAPNVHIKSIVQPSLATDCVNPHYFNVRGTYVREDDREVAWIKPGKARPPEIASRIRINHYFVRSAADWRSKVTRPGAFTGGKRDPGMFGDYDRNEVRDDSALRHLHLVQPYL